MEPFCSDRSTMGALKLLVVFFPLLSSSLFRLSTAVDTITPNQSLVDGQTLVSSGGAFELGFFSPGDTKNRYLGIWYKRVPVQTVAWVANRESPITTSTGVLHLTADGNLTLRAHSSGGVLWSTATSAGSDTIVQLLDSGNLVVNDSGTSVWQSFDHPSNTLFPGMKFGWDLRTKFERRLTSWTSPSDPSPGAFTLSVDLRGSPEVYTLNGSATTCRSGPWDGKSWGGVASMKNNGIFSYQFVSTPDEVYYLYEITDNSIISMLVLNQQGVVQQLVWLSGEWRANWFVPRDQCDDYAQCGAFGVCTSGDAELCKCLTGFVPRSPAEWNLRDASDGCVRRTALSCRGGDGFLKAAGVKLPDTANATVDEGKGFDECRDGCLMNCSCVAFAFLSGASGCLNWHGELIDIRAFSQGGGDDLYLRLAASEFDAGSKRKVLVIVVVTASLALLIFSTLVYFVWMRRRKHKGIREVPMEQSLFTLGKDMTIKLGESTDLNSEFSLFHFSNLVYATNNFSAANKLGEGGFGSVYKGRLLKGQEIAVKRLEAHSGQGAEEFKNEILLIAKLQHRNLVKLLGCCAEGEEKILIYEYLPNKSLDFLLFDPIRGAELNWGRRFHIIEGIAQGLLYLHKHSRLRIIHRDLKASNILLDADMNPKISDFGMARIFGSNEIQTRTKRIVGTYGYMSPEYTLEGLFSIKSDVFSFGVILLEIISGKRNCGFRRNGDSLNLLGYAWKLWKEAKWQELVDPLLDGKYSMSEVSRCIHVALMCVQESAVDRPTMSDVITMLGSESIDLPNPKQPGFFNVRIVTKLDLPSESVEVYSQNELTITITDGR